MSNIIPALGAGTFRLKDQDAFDSVTMALEEGYRHIDTAQIYGNEKDVGKAIAASSIDRSEIFLTTKIWMDKLPGDKFLDSVKESLTKLQTSYIDLLLIHWPLKNNEVAMEDYLTSLKEVKDAGLARHIGISNFTSAQVEQAVSILGEREILTNQIEVHPYLQNEKVIACCEKHSIEVTAYMPFAYGDVLKDEVILSIAQKHQATAAQVTLAWLRQKGYPTIPSSTKRDNLRNNITSLNLVLEDEDMAQIATLDRNHRLASPDFAPDWD